MRASAADFDPPADDGSDRVLALEAMVDAKGRAVKPPRCHGYANCCGCPVCLLREKQLRAGLSEAGYLRYIGFDNEPAKEQIAA
ncbi:MAG TPA: hypothetical protein VEW07_02250 [Solirubrobacterales bacterium]|nr:hypothetical protein [Solirubrobacterales bacterium]